MNRLAVNNIIILLIFNLYSIVAQPIVGSSNTDSYIIKTDPYLQVSYPDGIIVRWITNELCYSWVEYGENIDNLNQEAHTTNSGLIEAYNTINAIEIKDLIPGNEYYYRIYSRVILDFIPNKIVYGDTYISPVYHFKAPDKNAKGVEFVVFNDVHEQPEIFESMLSFDEKEKLDFVFLNGDIFNFMVDEEQIINKLIKPLSELNASNTPFILSRGNHESRGKFARHLHQYFGGNDEQYYFSFQLGPIYAIVLDCGEDKADSVNVYGGIVDFDSYRIEQAKWLENEVKKDEFINAKYKVVFSHMPPYYAGEAHGTRHIREHWGPIFNKANIDLLISGHNHRFGIHEPNDIHNYPIITGGGSKRGNGTSTIMKIKVTSESFDLQVIDDSGNLKDGLKL